MQLSHILLIGALLALYAFFIAQPIDFITADLGRHLKNGELFLQTHTVPQGNLYSYTNPDSPFINHHWASGVILYIVHQLAGFNGLSLFFIFISCMTLFLFFLLAWQKSNFRVAILLAVIIIPLLSSRTEIRPEMFSYLFCGLCILLLEQYKRTSNIRFLFALPVIEALWINLHIYFPFGIVLIGAYLIDALVRWFIYKESSARSHAKTIGIILGLSAIVLLLNPAGLQGVLYPLKIFNNYGYTLFENQSVWFLERLLIYPPTRYFKIVFGLLAIGWIGTLTQVVRKKTSFPVVNFLLSILWGYMGWTAVRNFTIFGYFALPLIAEHAAINWKKSVTHKESQFITFLMLLLLLPTMILINQDYFAHRGAPAIGLAQGVEGAAQFFIAHNMRGPIFNNYDIGGYLIYYLYPQEKVFVDNRPEAYPSSFFQNEYIPAQENNTAWAEEDARYHFNTIFFYRKDLTPWAQQFLVARIQDADWAPVYVDDYAIIFARRNDSNKDLITQYELPKSMFSVTK